MTTDESDDLSEKPDLNNSAYLTDTLDFLNTSDTENEEPIEKLLEDDSVNDDSSSLTLSITNVVVMASMRCHLRLKEIARSSVNVEYKALQNHVIMRLRSPFTVATIWSSGKIWCTGANSLAKAKIGARRIARRIAKCGFPCHFSKYRVVNIMATCHLPFRVRLEELVKEKPMMMSYEPELAPGLTFKTDRNSSTSLKLFSSGRIVIMGTSLDSIGSLVEELVPLAALHQTDEPISDMEDNPELETRAVVKAARQMVVLPTELPLDTFDAIGDFVGELDDGDDDSDGFDEATKNGYSTDDSTDSGASIDSGGMSTKPKRRFKKFRPSTQSFNPATSSLSNPSGPIKPLDKPIHLMSTREACSLAFARRVAGDLEGARGVVSAAAELRRQHESAASQMYNTDIPNPNQLNVTTTAPVTPNDPTWCRKAVASGSTKRACVVTYSGTEDSAAVDEFNNSNSPLIQQVSQQAVLQTKPATPQPQIRMVQNCTSGITSPAVAISDSAPPVSTVPTSLQYVFVRPSSQTSNSQSIPGQFVSQQQQQQPQAVQLSTPTLASITPNSPVIRIAVPSSLGVDIRHAQPTLAPTVFPIRLQTGVTSNLVPSNDGKLFAVAPTTTNPTVTHQFVNLNSAPHLVPQVYHFGQNTVFTPCPTTSLVLGSNIITTAPFQCMDNFNQPLHISGPTAAAATTTTGFLSTGQSNLFLSSYPTASLALNGASIQSMGNLNQVLSFAPTFTNQQPGNFT